MTRAQRQRSLVGATFSVSLNHFQPNSRLLIGSQWRMGLQNGALFAAPMPEEFEAQGAEIQAAIERAVQESEANGISKRGKEVTPWLLARVAELTAGKSLQSSTFFVLPICIRMMAHLKCLYTDIALIENTATIGEWACLSYYTLINVDASGGQIAVEYSKLENTSEESVRTEL